MRTSDFERQENNRRSSYASHSSKLRVAKLIDGYSQEIARDKNLPMEKLIAIAEAVPDFARLKTMVISTESSTSTSRVTDVYKGVPKTLVERLQCHNYHDDNRVDGATPSLLKLSFCLIISCQSNM